MQNSRTYNMYRAKDRVQARLFEVGMIWAVDFSWISRIIVNVPTLSVNNTLSKYCSVKKQNYKSWESLATLAVTCLC
jgi:hypothetical protein